MAVRNTKDENPNSQNPANPGANDAGAKTIPAYLSAALQLPASYPTGAPRVEDNLVRFGEQYTAHRSAVPGIMVLDYIPTYGVSSTATSALNRAAFSEFNAIRAKISGNRPYEPADHMIYRMCVDSLRELFHYLVRVYRIMASYSATNLYTPRALIGAMGLDFEDWNQNRSALREWLYSLTNALEPFPTVAIGSISKRHELFNSSIFQDGEAHCAQYYVLNQRYFYSYEVVDEVKGITLRSMPTSFTETVTLWNEMYTALQSSSDVYIIAADIRRAFETSTVTTLDASTLGTALEPVKLDAVLTSINNAIVMAGTSDAEDVVASAMRIYDEDGIIKCDGTCEIDTATNLGVLMMAGKLNHFNMVQSNPSESDFLYAARLKPLINIDLQTDGHAQLAIVAVGTEIILSAHIVKDAASVTARDFASVMLVNAGDPNFSVNANNLIITTSDLSAFDWHPAVYQCILRSGAMYVMGVCEDVQNYVPVADTQLAQIHDMCLLAEFGI